MIGRILAWLFPPSPYKLGKIRNVETCLMLCYLETVVPDPPGCWAGNIREWSNGGWRRIVSRY